jgi:hypothetical protein
MIFSNTSVRGAVVREREESRRVMKEHSVLGLGLGSPTATDAWLSVVEPLMHPLRVPGRLDLVPPLGRRGQSFT